MQVLAFQSYPLWLNLVIFLVMAGIIWVVGTRLEGYTDGIAQRTGMGEAFAGMLLLSASTSLPELATTVTAIVLLNNPTLAVHNLTGGVALQTAILVAADVAKRRDGALTFFSPRFVLLIEGVGLLILLQIVVIGMMAPGIVMAFHIGIWPLVLLAAYLMVMYQTHRYRSDARWIPAQENDAPQEQGDGNSGASGKENAGKRDDGGGQQEQGSKQEQGGKHATGTLWLLFAGASTIVLAAGWAIAQASDVLARQTGLGSSFVGAVFLALATSLPELSTTITASRAGKYSLAFSNIFGSNAFDVTLLFPAALLYGQGTIMQHAQPSVVFTLALGSVMTCVYLWGLMERENRSIFNMGWDSAVVLLLYIGGLFVLYQIK